MAQGWAIPRGAHECGRTRPEDDGSHGCNSCSIRGFLGWRMRRPRSGAAAPAFRHQQLVYLGPPVCRVGQRPASPVARENVLEVQVS